MNLNKIKSKKKYHTKKNIKKTHITNIKRKKRTLTYNVERNGCKMNEMF